MASLATNTAYILHPLQIQECVREWLKEDTPTFDFGGCVVGEHQETAILLCKSPGVLSGCPFFDAVFREVGCTVEWLEEEGVFLEPVKEVAIVKGKARHLLLGERIALNIITRASGVASIARRLHDISKESRWQGEVSGTRKLTPGFRLVEKYSLLVGGISTHRMDLSSMIMLKDNHIWTAGDIKKAVKAARSVGGFCIKIEVECRSIEEGMEAAEAGADIVMLDNFDPEALHPAAKRLKQAYPYLLIESSGGVTEETITKFMGPDIDVISLSRSTQGYEVVDFSLKIRKDGHNPNNPRVTNV